jgi:hypothetical protein
MCGIFGQISSTLVNSNNLDKIVKHSEQRGKDSSGLICYENTGYKIHRADYPVEKLIRDVKPYKSQLVLGHSRLVTNGHSDNQPVYRNGICVLHNGIIVNDAEVWSHLGVKRTLEIDSEVIAAIAIQHLDEGGVLSELPRKILALCNGIISCALVIPKLGKLLLFSNNGSLYAGKCASDWYFASESFPLTQIGCQDIQKIKEVFILDIPVFSGEILVTNKSMPRHSLIAGLNLKNSEEKILEYQPDNNLKRCKKCILPETMPYISFNADGVCNYCENYKARNNPKPVEELFSLVEPYRRANVDDCIVPFSGGRDSCYGLHLIVNELKMKPITYTYDWGMVTDLGRRNISRMCAELGVENIIVAADISKKRKNIAMNLKAWLKSPNLGMISVLTAGDKHFFKYVENVKKQTGINLNLWGVNPLEVTHFKSGFLGIKPDFVEKRVYSHGAMKQLNYQYKRFKAMLKSPGYFNSSLWDTLSGEYYRSFTEKKDYFHIFDYWRWDEDIIDKTLDHYEWERAIDTNTTWRIGDGTAAFYNYVYYTVAGFTEHDTFRSNQIREGQMTRERALELVKEENRPRYPNIRWYLDVLGMDFKSVIQVVNSVPKVYKK